MGTFTAAKSAIIAALCVTAITAPSHAMAQAGAQDLSSIQDGEPDMFLSADPAADARAEKAQICTAMGGKLSVEPEFAQSADFDGDGQADTILDYSKMTCEGAELAIGECGSAGCSAEFWRAENGTTRRVGKYNLYNFVVAGAGMIAVDMHGSYCDKAGAEPCKIFLSWNGYELGLQKPLF